jgi:hypothetical protein
MWSNYFRKIDGLSSQVTVNPTSKFIYCPVWPTNCFIGHQDMWQSTRTDHWWWSSSSLQLYMLLNCWNALILSRQLSTHNDYCYCCGHLYWDFWLCLSIEHHPFCFAHTCHIENFTLDTLFLSFASNFNLLFYFNGIYLCLLWSVFEAKCSVGCKITFCMYYLLVLISKQNIS